MSKATDTPGVIAPPPLLYFGTLAVGLLLDWTLGWPGLSLPGAVRLPLALALAPFAAALGLSAIARFKAAGTRVEPWRPATAVVTTGVYVRTRNPMYLAMTLLYAATALAADALVALSLLAPLLAVVHHGVIAREERYMEARFGDEYRRYKAAVRRWL